MEQSQLQSGLYIVHILDCHTGHSWTCWQRSDLPWPTSTNSWTRKNATTRLETSIFAFLGTGNDSIMKPTLPTNHIFKPKTQLSVQVYTVQSCHMQSEVKGYSNSAHKCTRCTDIFIPFTDTRTRSWKLRLVRWFSDGWQHCLWAIYHFVRSWLGCPCPNLPENIK